MTPIKLTTSPKKILIIKPSSLGDIVHSLPFLNAVHNKFTNAEIHWVVGRGFEGILEGHPMIKRLWIIKKDEWKEIARLRATVSEIRELFRELKAERFDIVVDLQGLLRSGIIAKATNSPLRIGFKDAREGSAVFYTHTVEGGRNMHAVDRYLRIAKYLGCDTEDVRFPFPPFPDSSPVSRDLSLPDEYAVIAPGARKPANRWPAERFGELASMLPIKAVVIGSKGEMQLTDEVTVRSGGKAISVAGKTDIKGMVNIIKGARFMVCNDTGPMHIAAALGVPVFAIFGPANPVRTGPYGMGNTVIRKDIACSPCYKKTCKDPKCLDMVEVKDVAARLQSYY